jgi:hypothetical protein
MDTIICMFKARDEQTLETMASFNPVISIDPLVTEYELTGLNAATNYIVRIKLYNEAGANEQKVRIRTQKESTGMIRSQQCDSYMSYYLCI